VEWNGTVWNGMEEYRMKVEWGGSGVKWQKKEMKWYDWTEIGMALEVVEGGNGSISAYKCEWNMEYGKWK
jgi:hypothetical protein